MKISVGKLRALIREAMISSLPPTMKVIIDHDGRNININIVEAGKPKAHGPGFIVLQRLQAKDIIIWEVVGSGAHKGYGPLLYDIAMEYVVGKVGDLGITPDTSLGVSDEAKNVWDHYLNKRPDVMKEALPENLSNVPNKPESLKNYYYKNGTPTLDGLENENLIKYKN